MLATLFQLPKLPHANEECDFECWIHKLNVTIPPLSTGFEFLGMGFNFTLDGIAISNLDVISLLAEFSPNPDVAEDDLIFSATIGAHAYAPIIVDQVKGIGNIHEEGSFEAKLNEIVIKMGFHFEKAPDGLIQSVTMLPGQCDFQLPTLTKDDIIIHIDTSTFLESLINMLKGLLVTILKNQIGPLICNSISDLVGDEITAIFDKANVMIRPYLNATSPRTIIVGPNMIDIRTSPIIDVLRFVLTNFTGTDGPLNLNGVVNRFTNNTGAFSLSSLMGYFGMPMPISFSAPIPDLGAMINFSLIELNMSGMNTWQDFTFFEPLSKYVLDTHTGLEDLGINLTFMVNVSADSETITTGDAFLTERADFNMHMDDNYMDLQLQVASPRGISDDWTSSMCMDLGCIETLMSPQGTGVTFIQFNTSIGYLSLETDQESMEKQIDEFINKFIKFFVDNYRNVIPAFLNGAINSLAVDYINNALVEILKYPNCQYQIDPPFVEINTWSTVGVVAGSFILTFILFVIVHCTEAKKKGETFDVTVMQTLYSQDDSYPVLEEKKCGGNFVKNFTRMDDQSSLLMTPKLPLFVRIVIPLLIFLCMSLFISSNTSAGASVFAKFDVGEKRISLPSMFDFGLINSIVDMWDAGAWPLSLLIAVMSCAWPYTKLVMMLVVWILPANYLSKVWRDKLLRMLDALGKWSLVDSYVMILMLVAFHIHIAFPTMSPEVDLPVVINLFVYPCYGFLVLMIGTVFSLALSHIMVALNNYVDKTEEPECEDNEFHPLIKYAGKSYVKIGVTIMLIGTLPIVAYGLYSTSFSFSFVGLAGWAFELLSINPFTDYSVIDLAIELPGAAEFPDSFCIRFTQVLYILVTVLIPLLHIAGLVIIWLIPMKRKVQEGFYHLCGILYAWSCLDVFIISILAAVMEISQVARFMVGDKCDMIDPIVEMFFADEELIKGHETCFDVVTTLKEGAWLLFSAVIFHTITTLIVNRVARKAIANRASIATAQSII